MFAEATTGCNREKAFIAIIITIIPSWAILTSLIVFVLLAFHRNLRSTKVYDDCSKASAQYIYYLEIRTGESSPSYARRRTTLTIDMFDDNQTTLARIFVPGHVIFGRKETPIPPIEDEKFVELRVTRFWLYRATKLKQVTNIRITHNCPELDAKIMVYGVELRTDEPERFKIFFPVMSLISVYGATGKPNTCFGAEPTGYISAIGGHLSDMTYIDEHLTLVDIAILVDLAASIIFYMAGRGIFSRNTLNPTEFMSHFYDGTVAGFVSYAATLLLGLTLRYVVRQNYALRLGHGYWCVIFHTYSSTIVIVATVLWILTGVYTYKYLCPDQHLMWVLASFIGVSFAIALALLTFSVHTFIQYINPPVVEQYVVPDDLVPVSQSRSRQQTHFRHNLGINATTPLKSISPGPLLNTTGGPWHQPPMMLNYYTMGAGAAPKSTVKVPHIQTTGGQDQAHKKLTTSPTYNQQMSSDGVGGRTNKSTKKTGSNESTGSTYYQQLIKTKGGVKSISQYGELLKQKKVSKHNK